MISVSGSGLAGLFGSSEEVERAREVRRIGARRRESFGRMAFERWVKVVDFLII